MVRRIAKTLAAGAIVLAVFSFSFLVFYKRAQKNLPRQPLILTSAVINQPLPKANLINILVSILRMKSLDVGESF